MIDQEKREEHESFGLVGFSRVSGNPGALFGSSIRHQNFIRLRVSRAVRERNLATYWYYARGREIVEIDLAANQFADLLTSMNVGDGVPCTLRYVDGKKMAECPATDQRQIFSGEFEQKVRKASENAVKLQAVAREILAKPNILKKDRESLMSTIDALMQEVRSNLPFVQESFNEAMDKTVTEAKGEVEAFVENKIVSLGIEALRKQIEGNAPELIDGEGKLLS